MLEEGNALVEMPLIRIVDDQPTLRESVADLLASVGLRSRGYESAAAFLKEDEGLVPGCILLDVRMPGMGGFELLAALTDRDVQLPVVFVTAHGDIGMAVRALKAGAVDFLVKPFNDQRLIDAVNDANRIDAARRKERRPAIAARKRFALLSEGERDGLNLTLQGWRVKQIADELKISEITVKVRKARLLQKLEVDNLPSLVRLFDRLLK